MKCNVYNRPDGIVLDLFEFQDSPIVAARRAKVYNVQNMFEEFNSDETLPSDGGTHHQISLQAIASYSELLGNGIDYDKTVREIMYIREHGEPEPDPITGENAWTSAYDEVVSSLVGKHVEMMSNELSGISKTRSMLGLPSTDEDVSLMSLEDDPTCIESYSVDENTSSVIASYADAIEAFRDRFKKDLICQTDDSLKMHMRVVKDSNDI